MTPRRGWRRCWCLALAGAGLVTAGCVSLPDAAGVPFDDPALQQRLVQARNELFPASFAVVQRLVVERRGTESAFNEYVAVRPAAELRLAVLTDLGNSIAAATWVPTRGATVTQCAPSLPERAVRAWLRDVRLAYVWDAQRPVTLVRYADGTVGLVQWPAAGERQEWVFAPDSARLLRGVWAVGGRPVATVTFGDWGRVAGWDHDLPRRLEWRDDQLGYRATAQVVRLTPAATPASR